MRMKATLLTLCLALCLAAFARWANSPVSADTAAIVCGTVTAFNPATPISAGSIRIDGTTYAIAPGTTITGQPVLSVGAPVCINFVFNGANQAVPPSAVVGSTINVCGAINSFTPATAGSQGSLSIGGSTYAIAANTTIKNQQMILTGSNMCLTASLDGQGRIANPSAVVVNVVSPIFVCGAVSNYVAATSNATGAITVNGLAFTIGAGVSLGNVSNGSNICMQGFLDVNGQLIAPSSVGSNAGGSSKACGVVTAFTPANGGAPGSITIGGVTLPIGQGVFIGGQNTLAPGLNVCLSPLVLSGGFVAAGTGLGVLRERIALKTVLL